MSHNRPLGADAPPRSARRGTARRLVAVVAVLAGVLASVIVGSAPASAAEACNQRTFTYIDGHTRNETGLTLTRTYLEKGALNFWGDEPATSIRPHRHDRWCAGARVFGTAMKVSYRFANATTVSFEAWRYGPGPYGSRCSLDGPDAAAYRCLTNIMRVSSQSIWVFFTLEPVR